MSKQITRWMTGLAAIGAAAMVIAQPTHAQQSEIALLRAQIEEMQARLDKMEATQKKQAEGSKGKENATSKFPLTFSGLLQVQTLLPFSESGPAKESPRTFRLRRGELRVTAPKITDRISGTLMIDPTKTLNSSLRARDSILQELQISYLLKKAAEGSSNNHYIDFGQFKIPVGYESLVSSSALPMIDRALIFTQRDPFDGGYGDVRDTGLQFRGSFDKFDYRVGVFNGVGDRQNTTSVSDSKAFLGQLAYRANKNLTLGISGGIANTGSGFNDKNLDRDIFNLFASYKRDKLTLQGEYLRGTGSGYTSSGSLRRREIDGYYAHVGYMLTPKLEGTLRYDYLNADRKLRGDSKVQDIILGLNYYINGHNAKIQANLVRRNGAPSLGASSSLANDRTELRLQGQVAF